jgi:biopolymer transport protein ExbD
MTSEIPGQGHATTGRSPDEVIAHKRVRQRHGRHKARIGLNITAMIDVVFLLLIFFMVATNFKLGEEIFRMDLPERGQASQPDPFQIDQEPLRIVVVSTGGESSAYRIQLNGAISYTCSSFDDLTEFLRQRRIARGRPGGLFASDHPVLIEPTTSARWEHAVGAFNAALLAEYTNISFRSAG